MAAASPSPLAASTETTNAVKLRRPLVDGGTTDLRKVFDEQGTKSKLDTIHQGQAKRQEILEGVQQTQLEDHETLQDNKSKLNEVHQTQTETHQIVEKVCQTQSKTQDTVQKVRQIELEDHQTLQDNKSKMDKVPQIQTKTEETVEKVRQSQLKDSETLFKEGTPERVLNNVQNWLDDRNSETVVVMISPNPIVGKSVLPSYIYKMQEAGRLSIARVYNIYIYIYLNITQQSACKS